MAYESETRPLLVRLKFERAPLQVKKLSENLNVTIQL